jgi:hypothetical protein
MNERHESSFSQGKQMMARHVFSSIVSELPDGEKELARAQLELMGVRSQLRLLCRYFGDNEWDDNLYLGDVIEKHLGKHLHANFAPLNQTDED